MNAKIHQRAARGFTLIEMVVVIVVVSIVAVVGGTALLGGVRAYQVSQESMEVMAKLRYAVERMVREARPINYVTNAYAITTMTPTQFSFTKSDNTQVTIAQSGSAITMTYNPPNVTGVLVDQVSQFSLQYLQADGVTAATGAADIVFVDIDLTLSQSGRNYRQKARSALRIKP